MLARKLADRWLRPEIARFVAGVSLAVAILLGGLMFVTNDSGRTTFGTSLGNDYAEFYVAGQILNAGESQRLYDLDHQDERLHRLLPKLSKDEHLPFVYPPFLALIFSTMARLPFAWSFASWLVITLGLYALSVGLTLRICDRIRDRFTAWMLAFAFTPFAMECCLGGQISAIGCLAVSVGLFCRSLGRPIASGVALSILFYKPSLILLILPMLLIGRAWRTLLGVIFGAVILGIISWWAVGLSGCLDFVGLMAGYGRSGGSVGQGFKTIKYVDLTAFWRLLGVRPSFCRPFALVVGLPILGTLVIAWVRSRAGKITDFTWASTLCLTPVLNIYGPIYDVTLVVPGLLIGANAVRSASSEGWPIGFRWLLAFLFISALLTQVLAQKVGFQPLTIGLLALGLDFLRRERVPVSTIVGDLCPDSTSQRASGSL